MVPETTLYLVGLPEGEMLAPALQWQREMAEKYRLYVKEPLPPLHLTLAVMDEPGAALPQLIQELGKLCEQIPPFPICVSGISCFGPPALAVALYVEPTQVLEEVTAQFKAAISRAGGQLKPLWKDWVYHITLSSATTSDRPWDETCHQHACYGLSQQRLQLEGKISEVALAKASPLAEVVRFPLGGSVKKYFWDHL